jgi:hypothetical protein
MAGQSAVGAEVYSSDGQRIGQVAEVSSPYFRVSDGFQPAYWLRQEWIASGDTSADRVIVAFDQADLEEFKVDLAA